MQLRINKLSFMPQFPQFHASCIAASVLSGIYPRCVGKLAIPHGYLYVRQNVLQSQQGSQKKSCITSKVLDLKPLQSLSQHDCQ
jgi:hypothetical protein